MLHWWHLFIDLFLFTLHKPYLFCNLHFYVIAHTQTNWILFQVTRLSLYHNHISRIQPSAFDGIKRYGCIVPSIGSHIFCFWFFTLLVLLTFLWLHIKLLVHRHFILLKILFWNLLCFLAHLNQATI